MRARAFLLSLAASLLVTTALRATTLHVFAAASLIDALNEMAPHFEKTHGDKLVFNFAASNILARQILEGAPADVFISADETQMDGLQEAGFLLEGTRRRLLSNTLAVVVGIDSHLQILGPQQLAADTLKRLALADTRAVPAGVYAKEYLEKNGVWEALKERVVPTENVRAALAAVESGNADAGIVYKTDATISKVVKVAYVVPPHEGPRISYPIAIIKNSGHPDAARRFVAYLTTEAAMAVFRRYGFLIGDRVLP